MSRTTTTLMERLYHVPWSVCVSSGWRFCRGTHQQPAFQNDIWGNYILPIFGEEAYSRLLLANNSCLGAKELPCPLQEVDLLGAGEVTEEGQCPCLCALRAGLPVPLPATARSQQVH